MKRWALVLLLLASCGPRPGANSPTSGACWPVVPLRLDALEHGSEWEPMVWMEADGSVHHTKTNSAYARVAPDRVHLGDEDLVCAADRTITATKGASGMRYDASDALFVDPMRIFVRDDGEVEMSQGTAVIFGAGGKGRARVVGDIRAARRTAELLVVLALAGPPH
ncbi:MAG: hypothetical protein ACXVEF_26920 [Polyangiales bacterium]